MSGPTDPFCCAMRRHFLIGVIGVAPGPAPAEVGEFVLDFEAKPMILRTKFCPFCGRPIDNTQALRVPTRT